DRLQRGDKLRADHDGIDRGMRTRRMSAAPLDPDVDGIRRCHDRTGTDRKGADRDSGTVVHAVDLLDAEAVEQPVLDHRGGTGTALFRRLEDDHGLAGEVPRLREVARRTKQHGGMAVMAARMHPARRPGGVRQAGRLLDRQRVHVGAKADHPDIAAADRLAAPYYTLDTRADATP